MALQALTAEPDLWVAYEDEGTPCSRRSAGQISNQHIRWTDDDDLARTPQQRWMDWCSAATSRTRRSLASAMNFFRLLMSRAGCGCVRLRRRSAERRGVGVRRDAGASSRAGTVHRPDIAPGMLDAERPTPRSGARRSPAGCDLPFEPTDDAVGGCDPRPPVRPESSVIQSENWRAYELLTQAGVGSSIATATVCCRDCPGAAG